MGRGLKTEKMIKDFSEEVKLADKEVKKEARSHLKKEKRLEKKILTLEDKLSKVQSDIESIKCQINEKINSKGEELTKKLGIRMRRALKRFEMNVDPDVDFIKKALKKIRKPGGGRYKVRVVNGPGEVLAAMKSLDKRLGDVDENHPANRWLEGNPRRTWSKRAIEKGLSVYRESGPYGRSFSSGSIGDGLLKESRSVTREFLAQWEAVHRG